MEIIEHGHPEKVSENQNNRTTTCPFCGCKMKFASSDIHYNSRRRGDWDNSRESIAAEAGYDGELKCPDCHYYFFIDCLNHARKPSSFDFERDRYEENYQKKLAKQRSTGILE